jgi:hypothetical protein
LTDGFPFQKGQPQAIRQAFLEAMGVARPAPK